MTVPVGSSRTGFAAPSPTLRPTLPLSPLRSARAIVTTCHTPSDRLQWSTECCLGFATHQPGLGGGVAVKRRDLASANVLLEAKMYLFVFTTARAMQSTMEFHCVGCIHPPTHIHTHTQIYTSLQQVYVGAPRWCIPLRPQVWWDGCIGISLAVPFRVFVEPVDQFLTDFSLRARLVVGYCIHRAHSAFCTPWGRRDPHTHTHTHTLRE